MVLELCFMLIRDPRRKRGESDEDSDEDGVSKRSDSPPAKRVRSTRAA